MIGTTLAHYRIESKLGQGGMGEVWKATDSKLGRAVALKLLPEAFARDAERMGRFQREAQLLASLNHPNIGAIYGLEHDSGRHALVLELIDGPTLTDRIRQGALPPREALAVARQIADALQAAHERGVIHRDLKPENVKLTADGQVKVLDFGLAKAMDDSPSSSGSGDFTQSPTISPALSAMTGANVILGTAGYMSPEQARGQVADKRADIWAFGVILFEMLTGRRLFAGDTVSDSLAAVLKTEPDWEDLPPAVPAAARRLLRRCLEKDPKLRLHDIADARLEIDEAIAAPEGDQEGASAEVRAAAAAGRRVGAIGIAVGVLAVALSVWAPWRKDAAPPAPAEAGPTLRLTLPLKEGVPGQGWREIPLLDISRDGTRIVRTAEVGDSLRLFLRDLVSGEETLLASDAGSAPFFEPGGTRIGSMDFYGMFFTRPGDRSPTPLARIGNNPRGAYWAEDGRVVYTRATDDGLLTVDPRTGTVDTLTVLEQGGNIRSHRWPAPLPDGRGVLYTAGTEDILSFDDAEIHVLDLRTGESKSLARGSFARYAPTGHLLWARDGMLLAAPFDREWLELTGDAIPVIRDLATRPASGVAHYALSDTGTLVYIPGAATEGLSSVCRVDRDGNVTVMELPPRFYQGAEMSPDGSRLVLDVDNANANIWIWDSGRADLSRLTFRGSNNNPVWTPDGRSVVYASSRGGRTAIYRQPAGGGSEAERLTPLDSPGATPTVSGDGRYLAYFSHAGGDLWMRRIDREDECRPLLATEFAEWAPKLSPDGRWLAYCSDESGRDELYVRPFPEGEGRWKVSTNGADEGAWAPDGSHLYWISEDQRMMEASLDAAGPGAQVGRPQALFSAEDYWDRIALTPDGDFLLIRAEPDPWQPDHMVVVVNWFEELKRLVPR